MSLLDRLDVPLAKSRASISPVDRPRVTASSAAPQPTTPPPTTRTSSSMPERSRSRAVVRLAGERVIRRAPVCSLEVSLDVDPVQGALDGLAPPGIPAASTLLAPRGLPPLGLLPVLPQLIGAGPESGRQTCSVCRAESGRLRDPRLDDGDAEDVGLQLHADPVGRDTAVDLEHLERDAGVHGHRVGDVAALVADRLQR